MALVDEAAPLTDVPVAPPDADVSELVIDCADELTPGPELDDPDVGAITPGGTI